MATWNTVNSVGGAAFPINGERLSPEARLWRTTP